MKVMSDVLHQLYTSGPARVDHTDLRCISKYEISLLNAEEKLINLSSQSFSMRGISTWAALLKRWVVNGGEMINWENKSITSGKV